MMPDRMKPRSRARRSRGRSPKRWGALGEFKCWDHNQWGIGGVKTDVIAALVIACDEFFFALDEMSLLAPIVIAVSNT